MTIVAANLEMMISDRLVNDCDTKGHYNKIYRVNGDLIGFAGDPDLGHLFIEWYKDQTQDKPFEHFNFEDFEALVLTNHGLFYYTKTFLPHPVAPNYAIGTGRQFVQGAFEYARLLNLPMDLKTAVLSASNLDMHSGYGIKIVCLHEGSTCDKVNLHEP